MSPAPDAAQRQAAADLELRERMRRVEEGILERAPEHDLEPSLDRIRAVLDLLGEPQRTCLLYTSPSPRDRTRSRMPSSA